MVPIQKQKGTKDCGLFTIAIMTSLAYDENPSDVTYKQDSLRSHLIECFKNKSMFLFQDFNMVKTVCSYVSPACNRNNHLSVNCCMVYIPFHFLLIHVYKQSQLCNIHAVKQLLICCLQTILIHITTQFTLRASVMPAA